MLTLTRKADYALLAMSHLARTAPDRSSAREIAEQIGVPLPVLTNVLNRLLHHGLVNSKMGAKGGYTLSRGPDEVSLTDMIDAIEGQFRMAICCQDEPTALADQCDLESTCQIKEPIRRVHQGIRAYMSQVTLGHIAFNRVPLTIGSSLGPFGQVSAGVSRGEGCGGNGSRRTESKIAGAGSRAEAPASCLSESLAKSSLGEAKVGDEVR